MAKTKKSPEIEELPSNSIASRSAPVRPSKRGEKQVDMFEEPLTPRVARAKVFRDVEKKKTLSMKIAESFVGDGSNGVGSYIINDVLLPAFKNLITDAVTSGIEMLVYGETKGRSRGRGRGSGPKIINYSSFSRRRDRYEEDDEEEDDRRYRRRRSVTVNDPFDLNSIYFDDHADAEDVLRELCDYVEKYDQVSVATYFDMAGIPGVTHTHYKWGWDDLRPAKAFNTHTRRGWRIVLPDPIELD